jgi:hypothetical protein
MAEAQVESSPSDVRRENWFDPLRAPRRIYAFLHKEWLWDDHFWREAVVGETPTSCESCQLSAN